MNFEVSNKKQDESGRILNLDVKISNNDFLLINLYNFNKEEFEQVNILSTLYNHLDNITGLNCKNKYLEEILIYLSIYHSKYMVEIKGWKTNL